MEAQHAIVEYIETFYNRQRLLHLPHLTDAAPITLPEEWTQGIDQPLFEHELTALRTYVNCHQPFGTSEWSHRLAAALGLESTLHRRSRPAKTSSLSWSFFSPRRGAGRI